MPKGRKQEDQGRKNGSSNSNSSSRKRSRPAPLCERSKCAFLRTAWIFILTAILASLLTDTRRLAASQIQQQAVSATINSTAVQAQTMVNQILESIVAFNTGNTSTTTSTSTDINNNNQHNTYNNNNTIVTAYFNSLGVGARPHAEYLEHIARLFSSPEPMVIFTSPDMVATFRAMRAASGGKASDHRTMVIGRNFTTDTLMGQSYKNFTDPQIWQNIKVGPRPNESYQIKQLWNEKVNFLMEVAELNPFGSKFFAWVDAGMIRWDEYANQTLLQRIPPELGHDQMMVLNVTRITHRQRHRMLGGGLFGGYLEGIRTFHNRYYSILFEQGEQNQVLLASEQYLMYETCSTTPNLCLSIRPEIRNFQYGLAVKYAMFFMLAFLNTDEFENMKAGGVVQTYYGELSPE